MRWTDLFRSRKLDAELDEELQFHVEARTRDNIDAGMTPEEALRQARLAFDASGRVEEECRDVRDLQWLDTAWRDFRYALRTLRASPLFTLTAVASLALGIGANTAVFTLLHASLWKPLPVKDSHQIFHLLRNAPGDEALGEFSYSYALFQQLSEAARPFGELAAKTSFGLRKFGLNAGSNERVVGEAVSANFFSAMRVQPVVGRLFEPADDSVLGGNRVAVLSHRFWTARFQADPSVLGRTLFYKETPYTVVGVAQPGFTGVEAEALIDVWVPLTADAEKRWLSSAHASWLSILARLGSNSNPKQAQAVLDGRFRSHVAREILPDVNPHFKPILESQHITVRPASSGLATTGRRYEKPLLLLLAVVALVLLISCANVANLVMARNAARQHEITLRLALGASRIRIVSQLFAESLLLALGGAACGVALSVWACSLLIRLLPQSRLQLAFNLSPNTVVLVFTAALAVATAILFGLVPAVRAFRANRDLHFQSGRGFTGRSLPAKILVTGQLGLSLLLLIGAGLFLGTIRHLKAVDLGFRPDHVITFDLSFPRGTPVERSRQAYARILERLQSHPGVISASYAWPGVYDQGGWSTGIQAEGRPPAPGEDNETGAISAGPGFFETMGLELLHGRSLTATDFVNSPSVAVVNESLARYLFGNDSPIGRRIRLPGNPPETREVVGLVRDAKHYGVRGGAHETMRRMIYVPSPGNGNFFVRTMGDIRVLSETIRSLVSSADGVAQIEQIRPFQTIVNNMVSRERMIAALSTVFGGLAALLASIGLYGVMAYSISRRTNEFGIRLALGAQQSAIQWQVVRETVWMVLAGVAIGVAAALAMTRFVSSMLYEVSATDAAVFAESTLVLTLVAFLAGLLPARRASCVDPMAALRYE